MAKTHAKTLCLLPLSAAFILSIISELTLPAFAESSCTHEKEAQLISGFYTRGSITNASELPLEGEGFIKIFQPRKRWFGAMSMIDLLQNVAGKLVAAYPDTERLQIGDISQKGGGYIDGHGSHQVGLDADVAYLRINHTEQKPDDVSGFMEEFVAEGKVTANFDGERNWLVIKNIVSTGEVQRIFADEKIKAYFCSQFGSSTNKEDIEALRRLRPWPNHADHMHVRLYCPKDQVYCKHQDEVADGNGCDQVSGYGLVRRATISDRPGSQGSIDDLQQILQKGDSNEHEPAFE